VTFARQRGESDLEIQHRARWTSAKQLKTYDLSTQEDSFKITLVKRGLIKEKKNKDFFPKTKTFVYCGFDKIGFTEVICPKCSHIIDRDKIKENIRAGEALKNYFDIKQIQDLFN